jgi:hydroxymethylglutaryl-CoA reductase (NADPH)
MNTATEKVLQRRSRLLEHTGVRIDHIPTEGLDFGALEGRNCENVIGYVPLPVGVAGPLSVNGKHVYIPLATTEGCLVASVQRGSKAVLHGSGVRAEVMRSGMTRAPCVRFYDLGRAMECERFIAENIQELAAAFECTSRYAQLVSVKPVVVGRLLYLRVEAQTGDAMGY